MKQIPLEDMDATNRESAMKEVKILDKLKHPNIIRLYDSFIHGTSLCIVMEYAEGMSWVISSWGILYPVLCYNYNQKFSMQGH